MHHPAGNAISEAATRRLCVVVVLLCFGWLPAAGPVAAQSFGQWWWTGSAGVGQRDTETRFGDVQVSRKAEDRVRLDLGINGYLGHPALGSFRLGVGAYLDEHSGNREFDNDRAALDLDLSILPKGSYPVRLFARRGSFTYSGIDAGPILAAGPAETNHQYGGQIRLRAGPLKGSAFGFHHTSLSYADRPEGVPLDDDVNSRQYMTWSRRDDDVQQNLRLEHQQRTYGLAGLEYDDLSLSFEQKAPVGGWRWQLFGVGRVRDTRLLGTETTRSTDLLRLRNRFLRPVRGDDQCDLHLDVNSARSGGGYSSLAYRLSAFYRWRPHKGWEIAPFAELTHQDADAVDISGTRAGLSFSRVGRFGVFDSLVSSRVSVGSLDYGAAAEEGRKESTFSYSLGGSLSHGGAGSLRKSLEVTVARNELELSRDPIPDLPDLGLTGSGLARVDSLRLRLSLSHRWDHTSLTGWGEWTERSNSDEALGQDFDSETVSGTVQFDTSTLSFHLNLGETQVRQTSLDPQSVEFVAASGSWRPHRTIALRSTYRLDDRQLAFGPDLEIERLEAGLRVQVGQMVLDAFLFESDELLASGVRRASEGIQWNLSRRFAGWLPVVTGTQRRGVIR